LLADAEEERRRSCQIEEIESNMKANIEPTVRLLTQQYELFCKELAGKPSYEDISKQLWKLPEKRCTPKIVADQELYLESN